MFAAWRLARIKAAHGIWINRCSLNVNGNVDPNRARSSSESQVYRFFEMVADALRVVDGHRVLRDRFDDRDNIDFLTAALSHSERSAIGTEHAVGAFYLS